MAAATRTRIRVPRSTILQAMRARQDRDMADQVKAEEKYVRDNTAFLTKLAKGCEEFLALVTRDPEEALERCEGRYSHSRGKEHGVLLHIPKLVKPVKPSYGRNASHLKRLIKILEASEDEFISVAPDDDYAEFLA